MWFAVNFSNVVLLSVFNGQSAFHGWRDTPPSASMNVATHQGIRRAHLAVIPLAPQRRAVGIVRLVPRAARARVAIALAIVMPFGPNHLRGCSSSVQAAKNQLARCIEGTSERKRADGTVDVSGVTASARRSSALAPACSSHLAPSPLGCGVQHFRHAGEQRAASYFFKCQRV